MVTSYHNRQGLWHLPAQLMSCLDNYRYYFRLHGWLGTGGVIYALPKERGLRIKFASKTRPEQK